MATLAEAQASELDPFSDELLSEPSDAHAAPSVLLHADPPEHTTAHKVVAPA